MSDKSADSLTPARRSSRAILLAAVALAGVVLVIRNIDVSKNILLVLLGFGTVVLVHEFGHFVVAKACGIKVEAFSIFMPPILLGIKKADRGWRIRFLPELFRKEGGDSDNARFSFSVGKKILPGETEYRIGLIPFGGFVKMLGQDDVGPVKASDDPRSFANKPAWVRAAVLAAGVTFNVISAVTVFIIVFLVGIELMAPIVGGVLPDSPAEHAGIKPGDEIIEIAGKNGRLDFSDIMMAAALSGKSEQVQMKIRREDGTVEDIKLASKQMPGGQFRIFGIKMPLDLTIAELDASDTNELHRRTGLAPGDRIKAVESKDVQNFWQFEQEVKKTIAPAVTVLAEKTIPSSGTTKLVEGRLSLLSPAMNSEGVASEPTLCHIWSIVPRWRMEGLMDNRNFTRKKLINGLRRLFRGRALDTSSKNEKLFLENGDIILAVGQIENPTYKESREVIREYKDRKLPIKVLRTDANSIEKIVEIAVEPKWSAEANDVSIGITLLPVLDMEHAVVAKTIPTKNGPEPLAIPRGAVITAVDGVEVSNFYDIVRLMRQNAGQRVTIDWRVNEQLAGNVSVEVGEPELSATVWSSLKDGLPVRNLERLYKAEGPVDAVVMGYKRTKTFIIQTYVTLQRLVGGLVSPKQLIGPVGILTLSYRIVAAQPIVYYMYFLGLINASIAVLNFLPLPPFDGGLTVLLLVEKIKGSALSRRTQEIIAYVGWGLIGALLLYVTFNDIIRSIFG